MFKYVVLFASVMVSIQIVREQGDALKADCHKRRKPALASLVDEVISWDAAWREHKKKTDALRKQRNDLSEEINKIKKQGGDVSAILAKAKTIPQDIALIEKVQSDLSEKIQGALWRLPVILDMAVPEGDNEKANVEVRRWGVPRTDEVIAHGDWAQQHNLADFDQAAQVAGAGFNYLKEELALLDISLQRYAIDVMRKHGFKLMEVPMMLRSAAYERVVPLGDFEEVMYPAGDDAFMIATAEHPLMSFFLNKTLDERELPVKLVGVSSCWRREIGSRGVDTKGLFRMHQFNKVEQVVISTPQESYTWFEKMQGITEEIMQSLKIPYRVLEICSGDISIKNAKQYDIEAFFPRQGKYAEITSCSNCATWQADRLGLKVKAGAEKFTPHTLNNTALATSRVMVAIMENFQNEDGTVNVPEVLQKYVGFKVMGKPIK